MLNFTVFCKGVCLKCKKFNIGKNLLVLKYVNYLLI